MRLQLQSFPSFKQFVRLQYPYSDRLSHEAQHILPRAVLLSRAMNSEPPSLVAKQEIVVICFDR